MQLWEIQQIFIDTRKCVVYIEWINIFQCDYVRSAVASYLRDLSRKVLVYNFHARWNIVWTIAGTSPNPWVVIKMQMNAFPGSDVYAWLDIYDHWASFMYTLSVALLLKSSLALKLLLYIKFPAFLKFFPYSWILECLWGRDGCAMFHISVETVCLQNVWFDSVLLPSIEASEH